MFLKPGSSCYKAHVHKIFLQAASIRFSRNPWCLENHLKTQGADSALCNLPHHDPNCSSRLSRFPLFLVTCFIVLGYCTLQVLNRCSWVCTLIQVSALYLLAYDSLFPCNLRMAPQIHAHIKPISTSQSSYLAQKGRVHLVRICSPSMLVWKNLLFSPTPLKCHFSLHVQNITVSHPLPALIES